MTERISDDARGDAGSNENPNVASISRRVVRIAGIALLLISWIGCYSLPDLSKDESLSEMTPNSDATVTNLGVALYPYVPRIDQFERALKAEWAKVQPSVALNFISDWDGGYDDDPPANADVFVFDAMLFEYFRHSNFLEPLSAKEIANIGDFVDYAIEGVAVAGTYYAIPQLGCASILFYDQGDETIAAAKSISDLQNAVGQCTYTSQIPPDVRGLMVDMKGGTTNASLYLDIEHGFNGVYPFPLPNSESDLDPQAVAGMRSLLSIASYENATRDPGKAYGRGTWFSNGWGRTMIGFTEHMSAMSPAWRRNVAFRPLPIAANGYSSVYYADVIGINPNTASRPLAVQLANVMAASSTMVASIGPDGASTYPQYLMATRPTVFQTLASSFPIYKDMFEMLLQSEPIMFKLDSDARPWLSRMKSVISKAARQNYPCGCDQPAASPISDDSQAAAICRKTCATYGGWNGQWTNEAPAAPNERSVCGCQQCEVGP